VELAIEGVELSGCVTRDVHIKYLTCPASIAERWCACCGFQVMQMTKWEQH
jgi:hypothetical protein